MSHLRKADELLTESEIKQALSMQLFFTDKEKSKQLFEEAKELTHQAIQELIKHCDSPVIL